MSEAPGPKLVPPRKTDAEMYQRWARGNTDAIRLISALGLASQIADDFVDLDKEKVTGSFRDRSGYMGLLLSTIFVEILANPFFMQFQVVLTPLIVSSIAYWEASNEWTGAERKETRMFGFVHREALERVVAMIAYLVGGWAHQRRVVREMHEHFHGACAIETFEGWDRPRGEVSHG